MFGLAEAAVRLAGGAGTSPGKVTRAPADSAVAASVRRDHSHRRADVDPYRGEWSLPLKTASLNIDAEGRRITPGGQAGAGGRRVLMLGGSAMWGANAADSATIPALVAAGLRERGMIDVEVLNLAQPDFVGLQGAMTLLLELAAGRVPTAVVLLLGSEDVVTASRYGMPGRTMREDDYARWLRLGRRPFREELTGLVRHSRLLQALTGGEDGARDPIAAAPLCEAVATHQRNLADALDALARSHGFSLLLVVAPMASVDGGVAVPDCGAALEAALAGWPASELVVAGPDPDAELAGTLHPTTYRRVAHHLTPAVVRALEAAAARERAP